METPPLECNSPLSSQVSWVTKSFGHALPRLPSHSGRQQQRSPSKSRGTPCIYAMSAQRFLGCLSAQSLRGGCVSALLPKPRESLIPFCKEHRWVLSKLAPSMFPWQPLSVGKEPRVRIIVSRTKSSRHTGQREAAWRKSDAQFMWPSQPMSCFRKRNSGWERGLFPWISGPGCLSELLLVCLWLQKTKQPLLLVWDKHLPGMRLVLPQSVWEGPLWRPFTPAHWPPSRQEGGHCG